MYEHNRYLFIIYQYDEFLFVIMLWHRIYLDVDNPIQC